MHENGDSRLLPFDGVERSLWGDDTSGRSLDWVYVFDDDVCHIVFGIPAGRRFTHFGDTVAVYERDVLWRVLSGMLVAVDPRTGETQRVRAGESLVFDGSVWPHGFNCGDELVRVLEFTAPSRAYAGDAVEQRAAQSAPEYPRFALGARWPAGAAERSDRSTLRVLTDADLAWRVGGGDGMLPVGELLVTPHLAVGELHVAPGRETGPVTDAGVKTLHVLEGTLAVLLDARWLEAHPHDGVYIAAGATHRFANLSDVPAKALFQLATPGGTDVER